MQSSKSKSKTCQRKDHLLRFKLNSTATSDGGAQLGNDVRRDSESIATKVWSQIRRKWNAMFESHVVTTDQRWQDKLLFSIWRFFEQSSFVNIRLLCYWPTIHNSISKICPKFQVISSHFFEVDELLDEHWAKIVQSENISTPIYVECDKMYQWKVCGRDFVSGLDIQLEQSKNNSPVCKKIGCRWQNTTKNILFFFRAMDMNLWLSVYGESQRVVQLGFNSWWVLKRSATPRPFCVALSPSVHWHVRYCCALYNFFFLGFRQWQSRTDRVVNLNTTFQLPLFWKTWTRARASTRPNVQAWRMCRDYSYCGALELTDRQVSGFVYSWFLENTEKTKAS